ncbi:MAG: hypothetical protein HY599_03770 [Candidatus Omnitrophica bacterium]|nr:hypothetical protein [Candidatus Omnitrophota bacterium]
MSLLRGQRFAGRASMLLPERLFSVNQNALPVPASCYATLDDIVRAVDACQPDLVFLLSGYLFSNERLLSREALKRLLRQLRDRGCCVATSDPFVGLAPRLTLAELDIRIPLSAGPAVHRWLAALMSRLRPRSKVMRIPCLEDVVHLYPTPIPVSEDPVPRRSFFNPTVIRAACGTRALGARRGHSDGPESRPRWLFVISQVDLRFQVVLRGQEKFIEFVRDLLRRAAEAERHTTLVAPPWLADRLMNALPDSVELLPFCPLAEFEQRLLDAEYAFYWNAFSFSHVARVANELPIFLFDRGHLARTIKPYYEVARSWLYGGWEPTYLDPTQVVSREVLADLARAQKPALRALRERWQALPTPDELVDQLVAEASGSDRSRGAMYA